MLSVIEDQEEQWPWLFDGSSDDDDDDECKATTAENSASVLSKNNESLPKEESEGDAANLMGLPSPPSGKDSTSLVERERKESMSLFKAHQARKKKKAYKNDGEGQRLPAYQMRQDIVRQISAAQVVVVSGETGCGKTTQLPQIVLDALIESKQGARCNMICTQPRRISAIGVAERVAAERAEKVGETVGYSIRLETKRSRKTRLLFCTTGVLLRRLQCDGLWRQYIFVDEIHAAT